MAVSPAPVEADLAAARVLTSSAIARLAPLYAATLFISAALLFWLQPMFTRMVLPLYGGSPAVWTTAATFFQFGLLGGYVYAHVLSRLASIRTQLYVHLALLALAFFVLPVAVDPRHALPGQGDPITSLIVTLALGVGPPFLAVAASAPLLQSWFSRTRHLHAADPYFLYSASNLGSMAGLVAYPAVIETVLGLGQQSQSWTFGYVLLAALILACALGARRHPREIVAPVNDAVAQNAAPPSWGQRLRWMALAFVPSSLMLGVTQHISTEIASVPLLWIIPLLLYMLTYVNAFARRPLIPQRWSTRLQPPLIILLALVWLLNTYLTVFALHLLVFFVTALLCHGELALRRPPAARLTDFYLCIAVGGALGGAFNAVAAPLLFSSVIEYPLVIGAACMLRAQGASGHKQPWTGFVWPLALSLAIVVCVAAGYRPFEHGTVAIVLYLQILGLALYLTHRRPVVFGLMVMVVLVGTPILHGRDEVLARHRSFFGVHTVLLDQSGKFHVLMHGITVHGAQYLAPDKRREPTTYFHRDSPLGQVFHALGVNGRFGRVGVIGLGVGTTACYRQAGDEWTFFEIDPAVVAIATDNRYFTFLAECAPEARIVMGDGRLSLATIPDRHFDLLVIDTFSSDSIPVHMITREALALYVSKLREGGVIIFHISNQYLDLTPVLANLAAASGLAGMMPGPHLSLPPEDPFGQMESHWIAIAREARDLAALESEEGWVSLPARGSARLWTDDYSNVVGALKWRSRQP